MTFNCPFCNAMVDARQARCRSCDSALPALLAPGDVVARRYEVVALLGAGPLGATYEAFDRTRNADLALKVLAEELAPGERERADVASKLEMFAGRTIAGCAMPLEVGADDVGVFIAAPRIDGVSLRGVLAARAAARRPLAPEEALRVMLSLAASAQALHSATPHGALRPENVVVTPRGLILTDGAIAGAVPPDRLQARVKSFARAMPYVSPEAAAGKKVTATADLFALGAIAAELIAGKPSVRALEHAGIDPEIDGALRTLLGRDGSRRPGALRSLLDVLSRACGFERRPPDAPLPVPEAPTPRRTVPARATAPSDPSVRAAMAPGPARPSVAPLLPARPSAQGLVARPSVPPIGPRPALASSPAERAEPASRSGRADRPAERLGPPRRTASVPSLPASSNADRVSAPPQAPRTSALPPLPASTPPLERRRGEPSNSARAATPERVPQAPPVMPRLGPASIPALPAHATSRPTPSEGAPRRPQVPTLSPPARGASQSPPPRSAPEPRGRTLDGIDPRLLRAAQRLANERDDQHEEVDLGEVEVLDE